MVSAEKSFTPPTYNSPKTDIFSEKQTDENCTCYLSENVVSGIYSKKYFCVQINDTTSTSYGLSFGDPTCKFRMGFGHSLVYSGGAKCFTYSDNIFLPCDPNYQCSPGNNTSAKNGYKLPTTSSFKFLVFNTSGVSSYCFPISYAGYIGGE